MDNFINACVQVRQWDLLSETMHSLLSAAHHHILSHPDQPNRVRGQLNAVLGLLRVPVTKTCPMQDVLSLLECFLVHGTAADRKN